MQRILATAGSGYLSLETAAAVAVLPMLLESRSIDRDEMVVVFDTGAGFKSEPPTDLPKPMRVSNDPEKWEAILSHLRHAPPLV
jgi:threonine synthase